MSDTKFVGIKLATIGTGRSMSWSDFNKTVSKKRGVFQAKGAGGCVQYSDKRGAVVAEAIEAEDGSFRAWFA